MYCITTERNCRRYLEIQQQQQVKRIEMNVLSSFDKRDNRRHFLAYVVFRFVNFILYIYVYITFIIVC